MPAAKADKCLHYHSPKLVAVNAEGGNTPPTIFLQKNIFYGYCIEQGQIKNRSIL